MYHTKPGEHFVTSLGQYSGPAQRYGSQNLSLRYRVDKDFTKKIDMFIYTPSLRRVRRQPQPRRADRFPNMAFTFDDGSGCRTIMRPRSCTGSTSIFSTRCG